MNNDLFQENAVSYENNSNNNELLNNQQLSNNITNQNSINNNSKKKIINIIIVWLIIISIGAGFIFFNSTSKNESLQEDKKNLVDKDSDISSNEDEEETTTIEEKFFCNSIKFINVGTDLTTECIDDKKEYSVFITLPKSLIDKYQNNNDLIKLLTITADLKGKDVGKYDIKVNITSSYKNISIETKDTISIKIDKKSETTLTTLNLNENIIVDETYGAFSCGGSTVIFATNIDELYPEMVKIDQDGNKAIYLVDDELYEDLVSQGEADDFYLKSEFMKKFDQIKWDTQKEKEANNKLKALEKEVFPGISNFEGSFTGHTGFHYYYDIISLQYLDSYYEESIKDRVTYEKVSNELDAIAERFHKKLNNAIDGSIALYYYSPCGWGDGPKLLTEEACNQYHLNCSRW